MAAENPIHKEFDRFRREWGIWLSAVESDLRKYNFTINTTDREIKAAIDDVLKKHGYVESLTDDIIVGIMNSAAIGGANLLPSAESWWLKHHFKSEEFTLAERIYRSRKDTSKIIYNTISDQLGASAAWNRTAQAIYKTGLPKGKLPKYMNELLASSRRAISDPGERLAYERLLRKTEKQIEALAANGAPTTRLKKAYKNLLNKTVAGTDQQIEKAVTRAVKAKSKYIADRLARTEFAKAYGNAQWYNMANDNDVVAYRSSLSTRHKIIDICDIHANTDQYGMGDGIFPKDQGPPYPYHPHCMCKITPVYRGEVNINKDHQTVDIVRYVENHPKKAKKIMGKSNYNQYQSDKQHPERYIPNWRGMETHKTQLRKRDIE